MEGIEARLVELWRTEMKMMREELSSHLAAVDQQSDQQGALCKERASRTGAHRVFDGLPSHQETTTTGVLRVIVNQVLYPVTEEVLHQVFDPLGVVENVYVYERTDRVVALVAFRSCHEAAQAQEARHGRCIYDGCCWLDIQLLIVPSSSTMVMPAKFSPSHLSHDAGMLTAATTPTVASVTPSTTSVATITSSLANAALGATGVSVAPFAVEVVHANPSTQRKGVRLSIVKWVSRVRITRRPVRWAMKRKNNNSVPNAMVSVVKDEEVVQMQAEGQFDSLVCHGVRSKDILLHLDVEQAANDYNFAFDKTLDLVQTTNFVTQDGRLESIVYDALNSHAQRKNFENKTFVGVPDTTVIPSPPVDGFTDNCPKANTSQILFPNDTEWSSKDMSQLNATMDFDISKSVKDQGSREQFVFQPQLFQACVDMDKTGGVTSESSSSPEETHEMPAGALNSTAPSCDMAMMLESVMSLIYWNEEALIPCTKLKLGNANVEQCSKGIFLSSSSLFTQQHSCGFIPIRMAMVKMASGKCCKQWMDWRTSCKVYMLHLQSNKLLESGSQDVSRFKCKGYIDIEKLKAFWLLSGATLGITYILYDDGIVPLPSALLLTKDRQWPWDPGGSEVPQWFHLLRDVGLRTNRNLRREECHGPISTPGWACIMTVGLCVQGGWPGSGVQKGKQQHHKGASIKDKQQAASSSPVLLQYSSPKLWLFSSSSSSLSSSTPPS